MRAGQKMTYKGSEVLLFPLPYMYISQGEGETYSHGGTYNIDYLGWNESGRQYKAPMYAPCSLVCKGYISTYGNIWWSKDKVWLSDGTLDYISICVMHGDTLYAIGDERQQGEIFNHTGNKGPSSGDHTHVELAKGHTTYRPANAEYNQRQLYGAIHQYNGFNVNDTVLVRTYGYNWKEWENKPIPIFTGNNDLIRLANVGVNNLWG